MDEKNEQAIKETLNTANEYKNHLQDLLDQLEVSISQVEQSAKRSEKVVNEHFSNIIKLVVGTLERRRDQLLSDISRLRTEALVPLTECKEEIVENMTTTSAMLREGETVLKREIPISKDQVSVYLRKSSMIGILPEVPNPAQIASINVQFSTKLLPDISSTIHDHGKVTAFSPVQILQVEERPGGLVIHWEEIEEESTEIKIFGLQYCYGNARKNPQLLANFELVYKGTDTAYLVRDLQLRKPYSFRVSCRSENGEWKRWSEPYIAMTTIPCYEWESNNSDYSLTNNSKIATKIGSLGTFNLYSKSPLQRCNHSIMFHILEEGELTKIDEGLALVDMTQINKDFSLLQPGIIFINMQGNVYINGKVMTNHLPSIKRNSVVIFDLEPLDNNGKIRVTIRTGNREITYDWKTKDSKSSHLDIHFAMSFEECGWKVSVE